jgi:hypothetical protein
MEGDATREGRDRQGVKGQQGGRDDRLGDLITAYLDRLNDGERLERSDILAAHPELGPAIILELETFLAPEATSGSAAGPQSDDNRVLGDYQLLRRVAKDMTSTPCAFPH